MMVVKETFLQHVVLLDMTTHPCRRRQRVGIGIAKVQKKGVMELQQAK
jgi:hypothetical protein